MAVLQDGRSLLPRADFERALTEASAPGSVALVAEPVVALPTVPAVLPPPAAPQPTPRAQSSATTATTTALPASDGSSLLELRQQVEALQAQVNRQQVATPSTTLARTKLKARALVIGNGRYASLGGLPNPVNDARAIAAKLQQFGIDVDLVLDADRSTLVRAFADYQSRVGGHDVNILFYAGHGLQVDGVNYVIPVDLPSIGATAGSVKLNAVSLNDALEYLPARTRIVFLDACRDNPLSRSLRASRSSASAGLAPVNASSGTLVAYATKDGSTAEDGSGRNSPYTTALLQHLDLEEDIAIVLRRVRQAVNRTICRVAMFLLSTGCRLNEALQATWAQIDRGNRVWRIPASNSKSKRIRSVPLNDSALEVIQQLDTEGSFEQLFVNRRTGKPYTTIMKVWSRLRTAAGVPHLRIHDLRHQFASFLVNSGRTLYEVQQILGHSDPSVTQRYAHLSSKSLQDAANTASVAIRGSGNNSNKETSHV